MAKPIIHANSSARKFGGKPEDYIEIHMFMDSSKSACPDNRHRALTHNSWFLVNVLERVKFTNSCQPTSDNRFPTITNSDGKIISVRDIGEQHCLEDFGNRFIPTVQDYFEGMKMELWMNNGAKGTYPTSHKIIAEQPKRIKRSSLLKPLENLD